MENKDKKTWIALGVIVGAIIIYKVITSKKKNVDDVVQGGGIVIPELSSTELVRLQGMANNLFDAFNNCGTNNEAVYRILTEVKNEQDFQYLIRVYDTRTTTSQWWCIGGGTFTGDLLQTIKSEMSSNEINNINNILNSKGVTTKI